MDSSIISIYSPGLGDYYHYLYCLIWMKRLHSEKAGPRSVLVDTIELVKSDDSMLRDRTILMAYNEEKEAMVDITEQIPTMLSLLEDKKVDKPLKISLGYRNRIFSWDLGPYDAGQHVFILKGLEMVSAGYPFPISGSSKMIFQDNLIFRLKYESPEGWVTYSPWLEFDLQNEGYLAWQRPNS